MEEKRGQQLTLGTVIMIILGIVVLVFLIYGFSTGWGNLWDRITNYGGGSSNVDTIRSACEIACSTNGVSDYCDFQRELRTGDGEPKPGTCETFENERGFSDCTSIDCQDPNFIGPPSA